MLKTLMNMMIPTKGCEIANTVPTSGQCSVPKKQLNGLEDETTENKSEDSQCIIKKDSTSKKLLFCTPTTPIDRVSKKAEAVSSSKAQLNHQCLIKKLSHRSLKTSLLMPCRTKC